MMNKKFIKALQKGNKVIAILNDKSCIKILGARLDSYTSDYVCYFKAGSTTKLYFRDVNNFENSVDLASSRYL